HIDLSNTSTSPVPERLLQMMDYTTYNTGSADTALEEATSHILFSQTDGQQSNSTMDVDDGTAAYT
ncbi:hypothetical protein HDU81_010784, partial [Chytriomyces hyalinus]